MESFTYQSPLEGDVRLERSDIGAMSVWTITGGAAIATMPRYSEEWPAGLRAWYTARRDANLLGSCPLCSASGPSLMAGVIWGAMVHENDCAIVDPAWEAALVLAL